MYNSKGKVSDASDIYIKFYVNKLAVYVGYKNIIKLL